MRSNAEKLIPIIEDLGFEVKRDGYDGYVTWYAHGSLDVCLLWADYDSTYDYTRAHLLAENYNCFNKWRQAPLRIHVDDIFENVDSFKEKIKWLGSKDGYEWSNSLDYLFDEERCWYSMEYL